MRSRRPIFALVVLLLASIALAIGSSVGAGPTPTGTTIPVAIGTTPFATPAALGLMPTTNLRSGATALVQWQGAWRYQPAPDAGFVVDGVTVLAAQGGGYWVRDALGSPGAGLVTAWFVDSVQGDDANDCRHAGSASAPGGAGACKDLAEVLRRFGTQPITALSFVYLSGDFSANSYVFSTLGTLGFPYFIGERIYTGADGGPYFQGRITGYVGWDGGAHQEGVVTVGPLVDGGPALDPSTLNTLNGYALEVVDGGIPGLGVLIGPQTDAGTFISPGGSVTQTFGPEEPSIGDVVQAYRLTPISTAPGATAVFTGGAVLENVSIGSTTHSVSVSSSIPGPWGSIELDSCMVAGLDVFDGSWVFSYGSALRFNTHVYGRAQFTSTLTQSLLVRSNGTLELDENNVTVTGGIWSGEYDGFGHIILSGPSMVANYSSPCLHLSDGVRANIKGYFWCRNSLGAQPALKVESGSMALYVSGFAPAAVGTVATAPWIIGGTGTDAGLPQVNSTNFSGIVVAQ